MTTEIAILNKSAVALAADSAVTISVREPGGRARVTKIYANANKLFELIKGRPVGVMIYNSAQVAGVPWETLIKVYRSERANCQFDTVAEYVDDFLGFVQSEVPKFMTPEDELQQLLELAAPVATSLYEAWKPALIRVKQKVDRRQALEKMVDSFQAHVAKSPVQSWAVGLDEDAEWARWGDELTAMIPSSTQELMIPRGLRAKFAKLVLATVLRLERAEGTWSGIVIAGFGEAEWFPRMFHAQVAGIVGGRLVRLADSFESITNDRPAIIKPYAQTGDAVMFLRGIDPFISNMVATFWRTWSAGVTDDFMKILEADASLSSSERTAVHAAVKKFMGESWKRFSKFMNEDVHPQRLDPIEASAGFLSKGEIAELAENLVEITSLRNRVSLDRDETVGGATDVAVISRGDGFVWIKRKHYFDLDRNPAWGIRQALPSVVSITPATVDGGETA